MSRSLLLSLSVVLVACATKLPPGGLDAYRACDFSRAAAVFKDKAAANDKDYVLYNYALLSSGIHSGDLETAEKAGLEAQRIIWSDVGKAQGEASLVSAEAIKIFKGEPFEKSMASVYTGIIFYNRGDFDNARASFSKALSAIAQKEDMAHREDFALAHLLFAKTLIRLGDLDNARIALEKGRLVSPKNPVLQVKYLQENPLLFVAELGRAPQKLRTGPGKSLIEWKRSPYPERAVSIAVDGRDLGKAHEVGDLTYQAQTKGKTGKDTVQVVKGVTRDAAAATSVIAASEAAKGNEAAGWVALGTGLFALLNQSQADTRQWELLPDRFAALGAEVGPGRHEIVTQFLGESGARLPGHNQTWYYDSESNSDGIVLLWGGPCPGAKAPQGEKK